jgi:Ca2+-binding EF-hand superfamily protein
MVHLRDEQIDEIKEAFARFDRDGNGKMTAQEMFNALQSMGHDIPLSECAAMISSVDDDSSGSVNVKEFMELIGNKFCVEDLNERKEIRNTFK